MENTVKYLQNKWKEGFLLGFDCILFGNGNVIVANYYTLTDSYTNKKEMFWIPLCDTTIESIEKYSPDIWINVDIFHGSIEYNEQIIVFGDGCMGNEGFVASTDKTGNLNWGMFFTFSNPILSAEIKDNILVCTSEIDIKISIQLDDLTKIKIEF